MKAKFLTGYELELIRQATKPELWLPFALALETGLRVGDVAKIKKSDIFEENGCFYVDFVANKTKKHGKAQISEPLAKALAQPNGSAWAFPSPKDKTKHITRQALHARIKSSCERAHVGANGVSPHSMRKIFAVQLYRKEGIAAVARALQHSDISTAGLYALADWISGESAKLPLLREDLPRIIEAVKEALDK